MRVSMRDYAFGLLSVAYGAGLTCVVFDWFVNSAVGATVAVCLALTLAFVTLNLLDWAIWKRDPRAHNELNNIIRKWEHETGIMLGRAIPAPEARRWWRPLRVWWLKRKYGDD